MHQPSERPNRIGIVPAPGAFLAALGIGVAFSFSSPSALLLAQEASGEKGTGVVGKQEPSRESESSPAIGDSDPLSVRILELIEQLGADNYTSRLQAQLELERIGVRALDQLHAASFHADPQIASTARFMVQSNQFSWAWESDPFPVRQKLTEYGSAQLSDKTLCIDQLKELENGEGFSALCRLVRYETQGSLAKRAALLLMRWRQDGPQFDPNDKSKIQETKDQLVELIDGGRSNASKWVLRYASESSFDLEWWKGILQSELKLVEARSPETSIEVVVDVHRWVVEQIAGDPNLRQEALQIGRTIPDIGVQLINNRSPRAIDYAQWALRYSLPELVQEQHQRFTAQLSKEARFGYLLAESFLAQKNDALANRVAERTLTRLPSDGKGEELQPNQVDTQNASLELAIGFRNTSSGYERLTLGEFLEKRGRFDWAEKEYRIAAGEELMDMNTIGAMYQLAKLLHDQDRNDEAAKVIEPFYIRFKEDAFRKQVSEQFPEIPNILVSSYHQYRGDHALSIGDHDTAKACYFSSIEIATDNVDALIGLYKIPDYAKDEKRKECYRVMNLFLRTKIRNEETNLKHSAPRFYASNKQKLAHNLNSLAWLIANTDGDPEEAVFLSRKACDLEPENAAFIDTLSHCYAAQGKFKEAVEHESKAVSLEPHEPHMKKALERFQSKLGAGGKTNER